MKKACKEYKENGNKIKKFKDLVEIENFETILQELNQQFHNVGLSKSERYFELFKIILCKLFDEKSNKEKDMLDFQIIGDEEEKAIERINNLYRGAKRYYSAGSPVKLEDEINLGPKTLVYLIRSLEKYSLVKTKHSVIQDFFMKFAPVLLRKDLDQFFTPPEITDFMTEILEVGENTKVIDPAGGSADFLTSIIKKEINSDLKNIVNNIYYWDSSKEATSVAILNMIIHGDCKSNIKIKDSIESYKDSNNSFDICITNPPFGNKTVWSKNISVMNNYRLGHKWINNKEKQELLNQQLGILFIERGMKLLKEGGILSIILPNGYITNPSESYIRKWLLENYRVIAAISLPAGTFKKSGTGVTPVILIVKKTKTDSNYKIFTAVANNIGFNYKSKKAEKIFLRGSKSGEFIVDKNGNKIPNNDLLLISKKFKKFAYENNLDNFEKENCNLDYEFVYKEEIINSKDLVLCPKRYEEGYLNLIKKTKEEGYATLKSIGAELQNSDKSLIIEKDKKYTYLDIGEIGRGTYAKENHLFGWELPHRAKQSVKKYDILASKLQGSVNKFCIILEDDPLLIATNGVYRIRIKDEKERLNFLFFMYSKNYVEQIKALSTGSIMEDIKPKDFINKLLIPIKDKEKNYKKMKLLLEIQEQLNTLQE